jgi:hypothetical protein
MIGLVRRAIPAVLLSLAIAPAAFAQDFRELQKQFKEAIDKRDYSTLGHLAGPVAAFNDKKAVDLLTDGYDAFAKILERLWAERDALYKKQQGFGDVHKDAKALQEEINKNGGRITIGSDLHTRYLEHQKKNTEYYAAKEACTAKEREIIEINRAKSAIVAALGRISSDEAIQEMIKDLTRSSNWTTRAAVAEAFGKIDHAQATAALKDRLLKNAERDPGALVAVLDALSNKQPWDAEMVGAAAPHLTSPFWQVQYAAAMALKASRRPEAIETLADALGRTDGRLQHDIHEALVGITGVDKGFGAENWKGWFQANREQLLGGGYKPRADEAVGKGQAAATAVQFFGIPVKSKNAIFIIDRSGSMAEPGAFDEESERTIGTGGQNKWSSGVEGLKPAGSRKIDIAKYQLKKVLYLIPKGTSFNIIFFNHQFAVMSPNMIKLDEGTRAQAFGFIDPLEPEGSTDIWQALSRAMEMCQEPGADGKLKKDGADTIYLLTDGLPFPPGKVVGPDDICARFKDWNQARKIVVHTIFVSASGTRDYDQGVKFMERLATENGGVFKAPKQPGGK